MVKEKFIEELNKYFSKDSRAVSALFSQYIPANKALADDSNIQVRDCGNDSCFVSTIGLINGLLACIGEDLIALKVNSSTNAIEGFIEYSGGTKKEG